MSPRLPRPTGAELLGALQRDGWRELRRRGSHVILAHPDRADHVVVPLHGGRAVKPGTLAGILRDAGLRADDLRRLL